MNTLKSLAVLALLAGCTHAPDDTASESASLILTNARVYTLTWDEPGLVDSHTHVFGLGALLDQVNLVRVATEEEAVALIVERAKSVPKGEWIVGRGWDEGAYANAYPDKVLLTA